MKKLFFSFCMIFLTASFTSQMNAQTKTCTPQEMEACKKVCGTAAVAASCTTAQKAACQKVCNPSSATKVAATEVTKIPFVQVVNNTTTSKSQPACQSAKLTKNAVPSCKSHKTKMVKNEKVATGTIAQRVVNPSNENND